MATYWSPSQPFLDVTQRSSSRSFGGALRDIQKTAARETRQLTNATKKNNNTKLASTLCRVWQNSTRSRACRANFIRVHPVEYDWFIPEYGCMPIERHSIRRMRVLGAFPAVLNDLNFKFSRGNMPPDPPSMFMHYRSVHSTEGLQTRLQTNCQSIHSDITSPYLMRKQKCKQGMWK